MTVIPNPMIRALEHHARADPDALLFTFLDEKGPPEGWVRITRGQMLDRTLRAADAWRQLGLVPGDRLVMMCHNEPAFLDAWLGAVAAGIVPVPLNTALRGTSLTQLTARLDPKAVIASPDLLDRVRGVAAIALDTSDAVFGEMLRKADPARASIVDPAPGTLATIMCTSGTTGLSKGVMWTHEFLVGMTDSMRFVLGHNADDVAFTTLPLFHSQALNVTCLTAIVVGGQAAVAPRFSASNYWRQATQSGATLGYMIGSIPQILWSQAASKWDAAHAIRLAQVIPPPAGHYYDFEERFNLKMTELYGMTDIGIPIGIPHGERKLNVCGRVLPDWECLIVDDFDFPLPHGSIGELVIRARRPWLMPLGYWQDPAATNSVWRNLWFHTGDFVRRDEDGWFTFIDRKRDAIRRAGENISSSEVEQVLLAHPAVADAAVFGVAAEMGEQEVMAAVILREGMQLGARDLLAHCERDLPYFAIPRYYDFVDEFPRTENEKVRKHELRRIGVTETTTDTGSRSRSAGTSQDTQVTRPGS